MKMTHTDHITIGREPRLTYAILTMIGERRIRDAITARRRRTLARITGWNAICGIVKKTLAPAAGEHLP